MTGSRRLLRMFQFVFLICEDQDFDVCSSFFLNVFLCQIVLIVTWTFNIWTCDKCSILLTISTLSDNLKMGAILFLWKDGGSRERCAADWRDRSAHLYLWKLCTDWKWIFILRSFFLSSAAIKVCNIYIALFYFIK